MKPKALPPLPPEVQDLQSLSVRLRGLYSDVVHTLIEITTKMLAKTAYSVEDLCDIGFLCREMGVQFEELRKEVTARQELAARTAAMTQTEKVLMSGGTDDDLKIVARLCTGSPKTGEEFTPPKKGSELFVKLCKLFEIPEEMVTNGVVDFHYRYINNYLAELVERGDPKAKLLAALITTRPTYTTTFIRKQS